MSTSEPVQKTVRLGAAMSNSVRRGPVGFTRNTRRVGIVARLALAFTFVALVLGTGVQGASADTIVEREETQSAHLFIDGGELEIISPGKFGGVTACLAVYAADGTVEQGCADVAGTFVTVKDLSSATLAPTAFDLHGTVCVDKLCDYVYTRTVVVEATWNAAGPFQRVHELLYGGGGEDACETQATITGRYQPATGTLSIDGVASEGSGDVQELSDVTRRTCW